MALTDEQLRAFIPRTNFLVDKSYFPTVGEDETEVTTSYGIPNTNAFTGGGGGGYYPGDTSDLVSNFNRDIQAYNERIKEGNRPLRKAQFPAFPDISNAQKMYNKASADLNDPFNRLAMTQTFTGMRPSKQVMDHYNEQIMDHHEKAKTGQFGPSYIAAEKPTLKRKISDFAYDHIPYIDRPQSYEDIMTKGYQEPEGPGLPSIIGFMRKLGIQNYASLPQSDQAFIASQRGYTGPTIFGEMGSNMGHSVDPFGKNIESLFGNYAEGVRDEFKSLGNTFDIEGAIGKKYSDYGVKFNPETGMFETDDKSEKALNYLAKANKNTKLMRTRYNFRKDQVNQQKDDISDLSLIDQARAYDLQQTQDRVDRDETNINRVAAGKDVKDSSGNVISSTVNPSVDSSYSGGTANPHTDTGWSGSSKSSSSKGKGRDPDDRMATGGRVGLRYGGLAGLL